MHPAITVYVTYRFQFINMLSSFRFDVTIYQVSQVMSSRVRYIVSSLEFLGAEHGIGILVQVVYQKST